MAPTNNNKLCPEHSGRIEWERATNATLKRIEGKLDRALSREQENEKRLDRIYTIVGVLAFIGGAAWAGLGMAVRMGWLV